MAEHSSIEWTDATWTPIRARNRATAKVGWHCEHVSPGCQNCYSETFNERRLGTGLPFKPGHRDDVEHILDEAMLLAPLRWRRPRKIFVCSMTDLFGDWVSDEWIDRVFAIMALAPQHTFQVLTKRSARMRSYCSDPVTPFRVAKAADTIMAEQDVGSEQVMPIEGYPGYFVSSHGSVYSEKRGQRRMMSPDVGEGGYMRVQLHRDGKETRHGDRLLVHRLVLTAFKGLPPEVGSQGRHRDGNPENNFISNLSWGGQEENWTDRKRHGKHRSYCKLSEQDAAEIRRRHTDGETGEGLAREFHISATQVRNIAKGVQWATAPSILWPLANCWLGVSAEDQRRADERIPDLLAMPAAVRFVSAEPLLGSVDLTVFPRPTTSTDRARSGFERVERFWFNALTGEDGVLMRDGSVRLTDPGEVPALDWVIVGGESGHGARPMHPDWARSLRDQCAAAGVPFHFKQWGAWAPYIRGTYRSEGEMMLMGDVTRGEQHRLDRERAVQIWGDGSTNHVMAPDDRSAIMLPSSKKASGRLLDGVEHNGMPEVIL